MVLGEFGSETDPGGRGVLDDPHTASQAVPPPRVHVDVGMFPFELPDPVPVGIHDEPHIGELEGQLIQALVVGLRYPPDYVRGVVGGLDVLCVEQHREAVVHAGHHELLDPGVGRVSTNNAVELGVHHQPLHAQDTILSISSAASSARGQCWRTRRTILQ